MDAEKVDLQREYYDRASQEYDDQRTGSRRAYERKARILAGAGLRQPRAVAEMGAGSGLLTRSLAPLLSVERYVAFDISESMLAAARERVGGRSVEYVKADVADTGLEPGQFDALLGVDIVHHLPSPIAALREWRRLARPGARLAVLETNPYNPLNLALIGVEHEVRVFLNTPQNLAAWATAAGWRNVSVEAAPAFTPSGPRALGQVLDAVDRFASAVPFLRPITALWLVTGDA